jgi:Icc-related predicted phosphoesterase
VKIVCISDTHGLQHGHRGRIGVPDGDVLVCAGDFTGRGSLNEARDFFAWLDALPHAHKIVIAGNHDFCFQRSPAEARAVAARSAIYLEDSGTEVLGIKFWGSPWQPRFFDWAFNLDRGPDLEEKWNLIPADTDVLLTHGPPHGILDRTDRGERVGCEELTKAVARVRPKLHVFGHIHEAYGHTTKDGTLFVNASICDLRYRPLRAPVIVELGDDGAKLVAP